MEVLLLVGLPNSAYKKDFIAQYQKRGYILMDEFQLPDPPLGDKFIDANPWLCCKNILGLAVATWRGRYSNVKVEVKYCPDDTPKNLPYFARMLKERYEKPDSIVKRE